MENKEQVQMEKPECELVGKNGNVFNIIGLVVKALKKAGQKERAEEFQNRATSAGSYDEVLIMLNEYVNAY